MPKSNPRKGPSRVEQALEKFQNQGPYTLKETLRVAKMCARGEDFQVGDTLDEIAHKFSPEELRKLIHWEKHLPVEDHSAWCFGTGGSYEKFGDGRIRAEAWRLTHLDEALTDEQLDVIVTVSNSTFERLLKAIDATYLSVETKRNLLTGMRIAAGEKYRGWQAEYEEAVGPRDSSPERH